MMKICSIGNQICVAQDLKLYACCVCACVYFYVYKCMWIYIFAKFTNKHELESLHTLGFFLHFSDFIREYTEDLLIPSPLVLDVPGVPQFSVLLIFVSDFPSPVYYPAFRSSPYLCKNHSLTPHPPKQPQQTQQTKKQGKKRGGISLKKYGNATVRGSFTAKIL